MLTMKEKINNLIFSAREKTEEYVYSYFLPLFIALIALLFWFADLQLIGFSILVLLASFVLIVYDDFLPVIPFMFMIPMCFKDSVSAFASGSLTILIFLPFVLAIIFHFVKYPVKFKVDKFFYMLLAVLALYVIAGVFTWNFSNYFKAVDLVAMATIMPIAIHFFFYNKVKLNQKINYRKYFCFCFIVATSLASIQLSYVFAYNKLIGPWPIGEMPGSFCWANSNHIASMIMLAIPLCCYMMTSSKVAWAWFLEILFLFAAMLFSGSDGGLATLLIFIPFLMHHSYRNAHRTNRKILANLYCIVISLAVLFLAYLLLFKFDEFFAFIIESSSGNGRSYPYAVALENFIKQPFLGVGFGNGRDSLDAIASVHQTNGFFHSTALHLLACAGVVGIIVYVIYYVVRVKYLAKNNTLLGFFALFSFFMFACYGMIDNNEFNIVLMFMTTIISVVGLMNKKGSDDKPLPLYVKVPKF